MNGAGGGTDMLRHWVRKLTAAPLPVFPETAKYMRAALADGNESMRTLARIAAHDPAFAFHVFREANALANSNKVFYDLEHAMSVLGMQRVLALIQHLPVLKSSSDDHPAYRRQLAISHHAGSLTQSWLEFRKRPAPQEARWLAALRTLPLWAIALQDPAALDLLGRAHAAPRRSLRRQLQRMFGCPFSDLTEALFEHWKLSAFMRPLLLHEARCDNRLLVALAKLGDIPREQRAGSAFPHRVLLNENLTFAVVANGLSLHAAQSWYARGTLRLERAAAGLLNLSVPGSIGKIHSHAAQAARALGGCAGGVPAAQLLDTAPRLHRKVSRRPRKQPAPATRRTAADRPAPSFHASAKTLNASVSALRDRGGAASGVPGILRALLVGLNQGLGLPRVLVLVRHRDDQLQLRLQAGLDNATSKMLQNADFTGRGSVFVRLLSQAGFVFAAGEKRDNLLNALPGSFRTALQAESFMLGSLRFRGRPAILIYADPGAGEEELPEALYQKSRKLCQEAALALQRLEQAK